MRVKLLKLEPKNSKKAPYLKAVADIQLGNLLEIHGVKLIQGEDGKLFIHKVLPQWRCTVCFFVQAAGREDDQVRNYS